MTYPVRIYPFEAEYLNDIMDNITWKPPISLYQTIQMKKSELIYIALLITSDFETDVDWFEFGGGAAMSSLFNKITAILEDDGFNFPITDADLFKAVLEEKKQ